ncbi:RHS repeat protein [Endozoicomonas sp. SM1973]|uniref:RHS repeat protein n=1 Tax=Spartinivicinus marinus TaxID=2994442 RepID=A0A853I8L2_9GAMM|nr:RHS repeat protein [Spartinivicinus marinus]MCX4025149.1 RHS repeat protein [Spartinivicinus marinus]NYZ69653.1 RHS repeat protein [Spartinivicinus marinus]
MRLSVLKSLKSKGLLAFSIFLLLGGFSFPVSAVEDSDCIKNGGKALCISPSLSKWGYRLCDNTGSYLYRVAAWCEVKGGTWTSSNGCRGSGPITDSNYVELAMAFTQKVDNLCGVDRPSLPGWGEVAKTYNCNGAELTYENGHELSSGQRFRVNGYKHSSSGACDKAGDGETIFVSRSRKLECPDDFKMRTNKQGNKECFKILEAPMGPKENGAGDCTKNPSEGEPIRIATGNMYHVDTDIVGVLPLIRTYNSSLGYWRFNFETKLYIFGNQISLHLGDGKVYNFVQTDNGWQSDADVFHQLKAIDEADSKWLVTFSNNRQAWFNESGKITKQQWLDGRALLYQYQGHTTTVADNNGNTLVLTFNEAQQLIEAQLNNNYQVSYQYDEQKRLTTVTYPGDKTRRFHYENEQFPNHLTSVTDRRGVRSLVWEYDDKGRAIVSELANGKERYSLIYGDQQTTVTNPLGKKTTYYFKNYHGVFNVTKVEGHTSANCAAANKEYEYFDNGLLKSKTDWQGVKTTYQYNDRGLVTEKTEAAGTPQARTITTQWHYQYSFPVIISEPGKLISYEYSNTGKLLSQTISDPNTQINIVSIDDYDGDGISNEREKELGTSFESDDTDNDGLSDSWELNNNTDPLKNESKLDLDNDGFTTEQELVLGRNPVKKEVVKELRVIADSKQDWPTNGEQGKRGWYYGYFDYEKDEDKQFQQGDFTQLESQYWTGDKWDLSKSGAPYLEIGKNNFIPSGPYGNRTNEHWPVRRWVSPYTGIIEVTWLTHKITYDKGNGFTGKFYLNSKLYDQQVVLKDDFKGNSKTHRLSVTEGDVLDFAISPEGLDGSHRNSWDHGDLYISISAVERAKNQSTQPINLADSKKDWSVIGEQGQNGWYYGYFDYENDKDKIFLPSEFIPFATQYWTGDKWDLSKSGAPYLEIGKNNFIPSGPYGIRTNEHWPVRRWVSMYNGMLEIRWLTHKITYSQGNGFTGKFYLNGKLINQQLILKDDFKGNTKTRRITVSKGDILDFAISPEGNDGSHRNSWDHGDLYIAIDAIPSINTSK